MAGSTTPDPGSSLPGGEPGQGCLSVDSSDSSTSTRKGSADGLVPVLGNRDRAGEDPSSWGSRQGTVAYLILVERKIAAYAQDRLGPNRAGSVRLAPAAGGRGQDAPEGRRDPRLRQQGRSYILAPAIAIITAMIGFAVVPFGPVGPTAPSLFGHRIDFQIAPGVDIGIVYILAIGSLAVYA